MAKTSSQVRDTGAIRTVPYPTQIARDIMSVPLKTVQLTDSVEHLSQLFLGSKISSVPVLDDEGKAVGVITTRDLAAFARAQPARGLHTQGVRVRRTKQNEPLPRGFHTDPDPASVESWFTPVVFSIPPDVPLPEIAHRMTELNAHHLFVEDKATKKLVGVITSMDLVRFLDYLLTQP